MRSQNSGDENTFRINNFITLALSPREFERISDLSLLLADGRDGTCNSGVRLFSKPERKGPFPVGLSFLQKHLAHWSSSFKPISWVKLICLLQFCMPHLLPRFLTHLPEFQNTKISHWQPIAKRILPGDSFQNHPCYAPTTFYQENLKNKPYCWGN